MRGLDIIERIRRNLVVTAGTLPDYTDDVLYDEVDDCLMTKFERAIVSARSGYWCKPLSLTTTSGRAKYRIPARAVTQGLEKIEIAQSSTATYVPLAATTEEQAADYDRAPSSSLGNPQAYVVRGDQITLLPTPSSALSLRLWYYVRPSRIVAPQSGATVTLRGQVTAVNTTARTVTVNALPFDQEISPPAAITSGLQKIDIVQGDGWHELALVGATQTLAGLIFTVGGSDPLDEVTTDSYVRVSEQTDWPAIPDDFHRTLADLTSVQILTQLGLDSKAGQIAELAGGDMLRFIDLITPRVKADPPTIPLGGGWAGGGFGGWRGWWE